MKRLTSDEKKEIAQRLLVCLCLLIIAVFFFLYWTKKKEVWFCDEIYTYESTNGVEDTWPNERLNQWISGDTVKTYFAADSDHLMFRDIAVNLYGDHVPLYFWIFRAVSVWFFRGSASVWIGFSINLFFYIFTICIVYFFLCREMKEYWSALSILLILIVNRVGIDHFTVLRMYMMMLWADLILLFIGFGIIKKLESRKLSVPSFIILYLVTLIGLLTHYDYWIFYAITATSICLYFLVKIILSIRKKEKKPLWSPHAKALYLWCLTFGLALFTVDRLFPYWKWNLHKGKGEMALATLSGISREKIDNILWGYRSLSDFIFGSPFPRILGIIICLAVIVTALILLKKQKKNYPFLFLLISVVISQLYQSAVCFTLPDLREERYLWAGFVVFELCFAYSVFVILETFVTNKKIRTFAGIFLCICFLALNIRNIDRGRNVEYLFYEEKDLNALNEQKDIPWVVYGPICGVYSYYDWLIPSRLCFVSPDKTEADRESLSELANYDSYILYTNEAYAKEAVEYINKVNGTDLNSDYLTKSTNLNVYLVK